VADGEISRGFHYIDKMNDQARTNTGWVWVIGFYIEMEGDKSIGRNTISPPSSSPRNLLPELDQAPIIPFSYSAKRSPLQIVQLFAIFLFPCSQMLEISARIKPASAAVLACRFSLSVLADAGD
jgi:hypothetical protein